MTPWHNEAMTLSFTEELTYGIFSLLRLLSVASSVINYLLILKIKGSMHNLIIYCLIVFLEFYLYNSYHPWRRIDKAPALHYEEDFFGGLHDCYFPVSLYWIFKQI